MKTFSVVGLYFHALAVIGFGVIDAVIKVGRLTRLGDGYYVGLLCLGFLYS